MGHKLSHFLYLSISKSGLVWGIVSGAVGDEFFYKAIREIVKKKMESKTWPPNKIPLITGGVQKKNIPKIDTQRISDKQVDIGLFPQPPLSIHSYCGVARTRFKTLHHNMLCKTRTNRHLIILSVSHISIVPYLYGNVKRKSELRRIFILQVDIFWFCGTMNLWAVRTRKIHGIF